MTTPPSRAPALDVLAAVLILTSSFMHFVRSQGYPLLAPEILLALLGVIAAGMLSGFVIIAAPRLICVGMMAVLITWFIDVNVRANATSPLMIVASVVMTVPALLVVFALRHHFGAVASAVFGTILASTLLLQTGPAALPTSDPTPRPARDDLPLVVHLILDEHIGLAGIPDATERGRALRARLQAFYDEREFYTFPRAFSQYFNSRDAIAHALNFSEVFDAELVQRAHGVFAWRMSRNAYMSQLWRRGYRIHVYQPDYMDLCPQAPATAERCYTYRASSPKAIQTTALPTSAKLRVTVSSYLYRSLLYRHSRRLYEALRTGAVGQHLPLPEWTWERRRVYTVAAMSAFDVIRNDLAAARRGDLVLAHLLIPHVPYVYDRSCTLERDLSRWLDRSLFEDAARAPNTAESQAARQALYFDQVECVTRKLDEILEALRAAGTLDDAVILVHGDHGSRITRTEPTAKSLAQLTPMDFTASFSTLFAVRLPGVPPAADDHPRSLAGLMRHLATENFTHVPVTRRGGTDVYVREDGTKTYRPVSPKMIWFGGEMTAHPWDVAPRRPKAPDVGGGS